MTSQFYLVAVGRGDEHDARTKARGVTASFSLNGLASGPTCGGVGVGGVGVLVSGGPTENLENSGNPPEPDDQPVDLYRENEELKVNNFLFFCFLVFCLLCCCPATGTRRPGSHFSSFLLLLGRNMQTVDSLVCVRNWKFILRNSYFFHFEGFSRP